jgi:tripartite-type tricarboxylate transporter receptor subunit TctC
MFRLMKTRAVLSLLAVLGSLPASAQAQSWPARPVRIIVPFSGAGTADLLTRIVADKLSTALG